MKVYLIYQYKIIEYDFNVVKINKFLLFYYFSNKRDMKIKILK